MRSALVQSAHGAVRVKGSSLAARYHRIAARRGKKRALVAVAHSLIVIAYHIISRREPYRELGAEYLERQRPEVAARRYMHRIEKLGFKVTLEPLDVAA